VSGAEAAGKSELLRRLEIGPGTEARGSVIWLHGLGASGHDFEDVPPLLGLPDVRFVFPHAPQRAVTVNLGLIMPAWYDIRTLDRVGRDEDESGIRASVAQVEALVVRENERGVPTEQIVLAGFSQGGAIALCAGLRHAARLAGILVLSAYELLADTRAAEASDVNRSTPMLFCHGTYDPMVPLAGGRLAYEACLDEGRPAEWHAFPMAHQLCTEEIEVIRDWLHARFPAGG
jgi:phospholipase/carboxylesterase